jgi:hypothetical protein
MRIVFRGIDDWNRPVFQAIGLNKYFLGSLNTLCSYDATEADVLEKVNLKELCYFGSKFNCEPMGDPVKGKIEFIPKAVAEKVKKISVPRVFQACVEAALWAESPAEGPEEFFDETYSIDDLSPDAEALLLEMCEDFVVRNIELIEETVKVEGYGGPDQIGHDLWLTVRGHGAGFWDRGLGDIGDKLTEACEKYVSDSIYLGDDGKIHLM